MSAAVNKIESLIDYIDIQMAEHKTSLPSDDDLEIIDIIDTHIHLWNVKTCNRKWLSSPGLEDINKTYDINDYLSMYNNQTGGKSSNTFINLKYGIFMETHVEDKDIDTEINEITTICKNPNNNLKGMIIKMDAAKPSNEFIERLQELSSNKYIVGIRKVLFNHGFKDNKIPKLFIDNLKLLSDKKTNWVVDIAINIELLCSIQDMISSLPQQIFVLDHMGNHHQICNDDKLNKTWIEQIEKLSKYKNLMIKLSALTGGQPGLKVTKTWSFEQESKRIDIIIRHFGIDRCVYGCDWPVSLIPLNKDKRNDFLNLWTMNLYKHLKENYGKDACDKVFVKNPIRIYNLDVEYMYNQYEFNLRNGHVLSPFTLFSH